MMPVRLFDPVRKSIEFDFYLNLHGCPNCGSRDFGEPRTDSGRTEWEVEPGVTEVRRSSWYFITCPQCAHERAYLHWETADYNTEHPDYHLGGPAPSRIISPHEFVSELLRFAAEMPAGGVAWPYEPWPVFIPQVITCCNELLKFFPPDADEIPAEYFRSSDAVAARDAHPEHYTRAFVLGYHTPYTVLWREVRTRSDADHAAQLAAGTVIAPKRIPLPGLSDAAIRAHERWIERKQDGQRLEAHDVEASERKLSTRNLSGAIIENSTLDRADLSFARLHAAKLTDVRLRDASLDSTMIAGTTLTRCKFTGASMVIAVLGDAEITACDFSYTNLDRSSWYRSTVTGCTFVGSRMTDAPLDKAVFTDCDLRGVDLSHGRFQTCTAIDVTFVRCDLRDTKWLDRDMFRARFIDCKLAGVSGRPNLTEATFENPDLSPAGDGSQIATGREALALWGIDPDRPREGLSWDKCYVLTDAEYVIAKPHLVDFGFRVASAKPFEGKVWLDGRDLIDDPAGPKLDALLAAHRESVKPPPTARELKDAALAQEVIDESMDAGLSYEDTLFALLKKGFTREEAMTAMTKAPI